MPDITVTELVALSPQRLTDTIYALLRERILSGAFRPGDKLNVDLLAQQLNVSQTPIKGALTLLVAEGIVQVQPRRGTFVTAITEREVSEAVAIRRALELLAAETIADHATPADLVALTELIGQIQHAGSGDEHFRLNAEFHQYLARLSDNRKLAEIYRQLNAHIHIALIHALSETWKNRIDREAAEHHVIVVAIERKDPDALKEAISEHLRLGAASLLSQIRAQGGRGSTDDSPKRGRSTDPAARVKP